MTRFIGDVHGKFSQYEKIIADCDESIQVGDFGLGFAGSKETPSYDLMATGNHRFIRGNHDNPAFCRAHDFWIEDGYIEGDMMFVGGAYSIDKAFRTPFMDWWPDEECSIGQLNGFIDSYKIIKPRIMVTHTAPKAIPLYHMGFSPIEGASTRMEDAFDYMWSLHKPEIWIFGHWHKSFDKVVDGTRFICLNELEHIDLEV